MSMRKFNIQNAFKNCLQSLDEKNSHKENEGFFIRKFDPSCCAWDRGFFLQLYLIECDFSANQLDPCGLSHLAITSSGETQFVRKLDGSEVPYPVNNFAIYINREIFNAIHGDSVMRIFRARCIAHELLLAEVYANKLGPLPHPTVEPPDGREEDAVLCPWNKIEDFLHNIEVTFGARLKTNADFIKALPTPAGHAYAKMWAEQCVDIHTCVERTSIYLSWAKRDDLDAKIISAIQKVGTGVKLDTLSKKDLKSKLKPQTALFDALFEQAKSEIGQSVTESYLSYLVSRAIDSLWNEGTNSTGPKRS
jgi:hypothetical protein